MVANHHVFDTFRPNRAHRTPRVSNSAAIIIKNVGLTKTLNKKHAQGDSPRISRSSPADFACIKNHVKLHVLPKVYPALPTKYKLNVCVFLFTCILVPLMRLSTLSPLLAVALYFCYISGRLADWPRVDRRCRMLNSLRSRAFRNG